MHSQWRLRYVSRGLSAWDSGITVWGRIGETARHGHLEEAFLLHCAVLTCSVVSDSLRPRELQPARLLCPWRFSRQEYWSGFPCPPPGDLPNPGIEPGLPHCRWILYRLSHQGSPFSSTAGSVFLLKLKAQETCEAARICKEHVACSPGSFRDCEPGKEGQHSGLGVEDLLALDAEVAVQRVPCDRCDDLRRGSLGSGHSKHSPLPPGSDWAPPSPRLKPIQQAVMCPMCSSGGAWVGRCAGQGGEGDEGSTGQKDDLKLEEREVPFLGPLHPASPLLALLVLALISLLLSHHLYLSLTHLFVFL